MGCKLDELAKSKGPKPKILEASFNENILVLNGEELDNVSDIKVRTPDNKVMLFSIQNKNKSSLHARPLSALALIAGTAYHLIISRADAAQDDVEVPITITVNLPNLSVNASCAQPTFAGYTAATNANIGGLKGGNALCDSAYPGSHWASRDEIMKLGASYPWTQAVWLPDFTTEDVRQLSIYFGRTLTEICDGYKYSGTLQNTYCSADPEYVSSGGSGAPTLMANGSQRLSCCIALRALACIK
jgi:hypothetical protein